MPCLGRKVRDNQVPCLTSKITQTQSTLELRRAQAIEPSIDTRHPDSQRVAIHCRQPQAGIHLADGDSQHPYAATHIDHTIEGGKIDLLSQSFEQQFRTAVDVEAAEE